MKTNQYDPAYDPLVHKNPGCGQDYAPTYWADTAKSHYPGDDGALSENLTTDVVIIGSGFTGLSTALFLAKDHGVKPVVLEANQIAWGCTSRNGGQGQNAAGRLYRSQWIKQYGLDTALGLHHEILQGFELFKSLIYSHQIDCEPQDGGHLLIAHNKTKMQWLESESKVMEKYFQYPTTMLSIDDLKKQYVWDREAVGAQHEPYGISVHPLKLAYGYAKIARSFGAKIYISSPALSITKTASGWFNIKTPQGSVIARKVCIATGGYTSTNLHQSTAYRFMPILSHVAVTAPMTDSQIDACIFQTTQAITDTRRLRFYYRKLPDNRLQIGSRSAITGADASNPKHLALVVNAITRKFPPLKPIKIDYSWWGWVDVSHDMMPRVYQPDETEPLFYAFGYGGNGVSFSAMAGKRMAEQVAEMDMSHAIKSLPIYDSPLPKHPLRPFRRLGQQLLYKQYAFLDKFQ